MSYRVAVIKFPDGHLMYGTYETTTDIIGYGLYETEDIATQHLGAARSGLTLCESNIQEEDVDVMPYALHGDDTIYFSSRASRSAGQITGPRSRFGVADEHQADNYFAPTQKINKKGTP